MEGRWARLTLSAFAQKGIDYKNTFRRDPKSVFLEELVLREMHNRKLENVLSVKTLAMAIVHPDKPEDAESILSELIRVSMPWVQTKPEEPQMSEAERMLQMYDTYKKLKLIR